MGAASVAAVAALGMSTAARADENTFGYSITISGTSDYMFRGLSFTNGDPAFQPFIEFTYGKPDLTWYLDFWGSNIADPYGPFELDMYAGVRPVTGPISWDFALWYYTYPNNSIPGNSQGDYIELKAAAQISPTTNTSTGVTFFYTPDQGGNYGETWTVEGNASYTLPDFHSFTPVIGGAVGYTSGLGGNDDPFFFGTKDYVYWNAGLKLSIDKYFMDFRYWDTNISSQGGAIDTTNSDARFVFTAGVNLP